MAAETIREFLVSLGFKQDEAALRKFEEGINKATKSVLALAATVEGTAVVVAAGIAKFAANLESLYYASLRTGSSVTQLQALDRWAQNFGASAGEAISSVEGLAHKLRENEPGIGAFLQGLGVKLKRLKDGTIDANDALIQLAAYFKRAPMMMAEQTAGLLGINENTMLALRRGDLSELAKIIREIGPGMDDAAKQAHQFEIQLRAIQNQFEGIKVRVLSGIFKALKPQLDEVEQWINTHQKQIEDFTLKSTVAIKDAAVATATAIKGIVGAYKETLEYASKVGDWLAAHAPQKFIDTLGDSINETLHMLGMISEEDYQERKRYFEQQYMSPSVAKNNPGNLEFRGQPGATLAPGGRFAQFATPEQGTAALARQLEIMAGKGLTTIKGIISAYAPASDNNDTPAYILEAMRRIGSRDPNQNLNLHDWQTLENLMTAIVKKEGNIGNVTPEMIHQAALNATREYRAGAGTIDRSATSGGVRVNQQTTIHVHGNNDPQSTANKVAAVQGRVNADLQRNLAPAVQ